MILRRVTEALRQQDWASVTVEFVIVVAGIFLALQADSWNERRQDRNLEQQYLERLAEDLQANIDNFEELEGVFERKIDFIAELRSSPVSVLREQPPSDYMQQLSFSTFVALPAVRAATFSELESTGRISLIRDIKLRGELAWFFANYMLIAQIYERPLSDYRKLVFEHVPGEAYRYSQLGAGDPDPRAVFDSLERFQAHPRFDAVTNAEISYAVAMIAWLRDFQERATTILEMIEVTGDLK